MKFKLKSVLEKAKTVAENKIVGSIKGIAHSLRKLSIRSRLLIAFMLISILPIGIVSIYSNYQYENAMESKLGLYSEQILTEISKNIQNELAKYEVLSEEVIMDDDIQNGLLNFNQMSDFRKNAMLDSLNTKLEKEIFRFNNLKNIHIIMADGSYFYDLGYEFFNESEKQRVIKTIDESRGIFYIPIRKQTRALIVY